MIQPNFLELDWRVRRAVELTAARGDSKSSRTYALPLAAKLDTFRTTNTETDATYNAWRVTRGEQMSAFRDLRLASDAIRALCDEHGLDGYPTQRIVYTDETELLGFIEKAIAYLGTVKDEWPWVAPSIADLQARVGDANARKRDEVARFKRYTERAKERIGAYDNLFGLFREYIRDAKSDVADHEIYKEIRLVTW